MSLRDVVFKFLFASGVEGKAASLLQSNSNAFDEDEFSREYDKAKETFDERLRVLTSPHLKTLINKMSRLSYEDDYGNAITDRWDSELDYFIDRVLLKDKQLADSIEILGQLKRPGRLRLELSLFITLNQRFVDSGEEQYSASMSGTDYETFVADKLRRKGIKVRVTPATGDQGVDLLADLLGQPLVIQCKRSSGSISNKAVQEVAAGRGFYDARLAWVVSDAPFTTGARQLAKSLGVELLHHGDLDGVLSERLQS